MSAPTTDAVARLSAEVDGKVLPLTELAWIATAPCGCVGAATVAQIGGPATAVTTAEAARWAMRESSEDFHISLTTVERVREVLRDCSHDPKWGGAS